MQDFTKEELMELGEDFARRLKDVQADRDTEGAHMTADGLLCELLECLGLDNVVEAFRGVRKWYA